MESENNKAISIGITAILVISLFLALALTGTASASPGTTYYVNANTGNDANNGLAPGTAWKTITHAVNTVPAGASLADPNIIQVATGLYDTTNNGETFAITFNNAYVRLSGAGAATTTIDGEAAATILDIKATGITVEGFTIKDATDGIESYDVGGFRILNNVFSDVSDGVHLYIREYALTTDYTVDGILIDGNTFTISDYGVYVYIVLEYDDTKTGLTATIGDIDILDNVFNMGATTGIDIYDIYVDDLNGGQISMGDINIAGNEFYGGSEGIDFYGYFGDLTDTTVTVGDFTINDNIFEDQTSTAIYIDYYDADDWYGTTTGTFGDLVINGNDITSAESSCDAIYISDLGYWHYYEDEAALTVGNLYIEGNEIDVSGDGIDVYYYVVEDLYNDASVTMGEVSIKDNTIDAYEGIYLEYYSFGEGMYGNSEVTNGDVHIEGNDIDTDDEAIYVYYNYVAYYMEDDATLIMGDICVQDNDISADDDGIYLEYYDEEVGNEMCNNAYAELPDYVITGNTFDVTGDGIELYTYENPYYIYDNAIFDFGGAFIDDNTFSCEYGIDLDYNDFCYDNYDNSATIIGDVTITNNRFYDLDYEAICIYYDDICEYLYDYSTLDVGDLLIADNVIDGVGYGDGIDVEYWSVYSKDDSTVTMGNLDIIGNEISNVDDDGIDIDYCPDAYDDSEINIGRGLIQGNTIEGCAEAGIDIYMNIDNETGAVVNLGNPVIEGNTISNCGDGIEFEEANAGEEIGREEKRSPSAKGGKEIKEHKVAKKEKVSDMSARERSGIEREEKRSHSAKGGIEDIGGDRNILNNEISNNGGQVCPATISNNKITDNGHGIWLASSYNTIVRNIIARNGEFDTGVHLTEYAANNEIHENCFIDNVPQAWDGGENNDWTGNYWSPPPGGPGNYDIPGTAGSEDNDPLQFCPLIEQLPDLVITGIQVVGNRIQYTIENIGAADAPRSLTGLWINGIYRARDSVDGLAPGESSNEEFARENYRGGEIEVCADYQDRIEEIDETNNCRGWSPAEKPDLEIVEKWEEWESATHYIVTYTIHNKGTAVAPACHNTTLYVDGVAIEHKHVPVDLAYCETYTDTFDTVIECTGDSDTIRVCADNYEVIDELDETNNCLENEWICEEEEEKPDLEIVEKWEEWESATHYSVTYTIHNKGTAVAPACHNTTLYVDGVAIEHKHVPVDLAYCETYTDTFDTVIECTGASDTIRVCADNYEVIDELDETNNCLENEWICEEEEEKPDLIITDIWVVDNRIQYTIENIGGEPAPTSYTGLWIDGIYRARDRVDPLGIGDARDEVFAGYNYRGGEIRVCADYQDRIEEIDEENNCREEGPA